MYLSTIILGRLYDQHFIAASLKLVGYALNFYVETIFLKASVHQMEVG
uniref:Uncharacterized protein n=1 Tax=mine drainage metagenome TaxID=410659 RepID=E6QC21_9ZZZZ